MEICSSVVAGWIINFRLLLGVWTAKNSTQIARATQTPPVKNGKFQINTQSDQRKNASHSSERFSTRGDREWLNSSRVNHSHICILTVLSGLLRARPLISARLRNQEWHWYGGKSRSNAISSKNCEFKRSAMKLNSAMVAIHSAGSRGRCCKRLIGSVGTSSGSWRRRRFFTFSFTCFASHSETWLSFSWLILVISLFNDDRRMIVWREMMKFEASYGSR